MTPDPDQDMAASAAQNRVPVVDALPVLAAPARTQTALVGVRTTQAAVVAASGLVAGAATVAMVRRRRARKVAALRGRRAKTIGTVVASRSFLVDVHLLGSGD